MHLAINATDIGRQRGGNESYLLGLLEGLRAQLDTRDRLTLITCEAGTGLLSTMSWSEQIRLVDTGLWRRWPSYLWQQARVLRQAKPDWYLSTFLLPPRLSCRAAVLIHDLSFRAHPEYFPLSIVIYMRLLVSHAVRQAKVVIALSEFTRSEIRRYFPAAARKTVVVYPGIDRALSAEGDRAADLSALQPYGITPPYILAVGNIHPRKNLARLLEAYELLQRARPGLPPMVWVGMERWGSSQLQRQARASGVQLTGRVAPQHLPAVYRCASLLVYPSLYEGFGLPPIEAMACGLPVVASNTTGLPEAVGEAGLLVDPSDASALSEAIACALFDESLRSQLRARGLAHIRQFNWATSASLILGTLRGRM